MTRFLLALLALMGLAAQAAPVEARVCRATAEIGVLAPARGVARALAARPVTIAAAPARGEPRLDRCSDGASARRPKVFVPTVQLQSDRAAE